MRDYEVTVILQPQIEDSVRDEMVEQITTLIAPEADEANKPELAVWGKRRLAYPIENFNEGYYLLYTAQIDPERITDIERSMQYNEDILRYMVVRKPEV